MTYFKKLKQLFSWKDLAFTVLLFSLILVIAFFRGENLVEVTFGNEAVDVVCSKYTLNIPYSMVDHIELAEIDDDDELVNGVADIAIRTGVWTNEQWGEYNAVVDLQTKVSIAVYLDDGRIFVFSHKNESTVTEEFEIFQSHLDALKN